MGLHEVHEEKERPVACSRARVAVEPVLRQAVLESSPLVWQRFGIAEQAEQRPKHEVPPKRILGGDGEVVHNCEIFEPPMHSEARADKPVRADPDRVIAAVAQTFGEGGNRIVEVQVLDRRAVDGGELAGEDRRVAGKRPRGGRDRVQKKSALSRETRETRRCVARSAVGCEPVCADRVQDNQEQIWRPRGACRHDGRRLPVARLEARKRAIEAHLGGNPPKRRAERQCREARWEKKGASLAQQCGQRAHHRGREQCPSPMQGQDRPEHETDQARPSHGVGKAKGASSQRPGLSRMLRRGCGRGAYETAQRLENQRSGQGSERDRTPEPEHRPTGPDHDRPDRAQSLIHSRRATEQRADPD